MDQNTNIDGGSLGSTGPPRYRMSEREFVALMALISAQAALAIDILLPAFADMRIAFGLSPDATALSLTITLFFVGSGLGNLVYGPLTDAWGRKPVLLGSVALYGLSALASALATSLAWLLVARFVWGFASGGPRVLTQAIVRDRFSGDAMARVMSMIQAVFFFGPIAAPLLGAGLVAVGSWRWVMMFGVITAGVTILWSLRLRETLLPDHRRPLNPTNVIGGIRTVVGHRRTFLLALSVMFLSSAFFSFLSSSELIFADVFDRAELFVPFFSGMAMLLGATSLVVTRILKRVAAERVNQVAGAALVGFSAIRLMLALLFDGVPPFVPWVMLFVLSNLCIVSMFPSLNSLALEPMGALAGTAASVLGFTMSVGGAALAAVTDRFLAGSVLPLALAYVGYGSISFALQRAAMRFPDSPPTEAPPEV